MEWWQSLILGIVEGLTEYLPVSSTGHLLLTQRILGIPESEAADAFAICIQGGAIVAVLSLYAKRVRQMIQGLSGRNREGANLATHLFVAVLPAVLIGLLSQYWIKEYLFGGERWGLWPTIAAWFLGGLAILYVSFWRRKKNSSPVSGWSIESLSWKMALFIGLFQCLAMWPGMSRSLVTIVGGILVGLSLPAAVEFSFLLGVVTLGGVTAYDLVQHGNAMLQEYGVLNLMIGFLAAWGFAVLAVRWMVQYLHRHGLGIFGYYRVGLAIVITVFILLGYFVPAKVAAL